FRAIASNTNERTLISAVLPEKSCFGHLCWGINLRDIDPNVLSSILNTLVVDFPIRLRISLSIGPTHLLRLAIIPRYLIDKIPIIETVSVYDDRLISIYINLNKYEKMWRLNKAVAEAYGLNADDFEYILSTFPVFQRKRPEFCQFMKKKIKEWKEETITKPEKSEYQSHIAFDISVADELKDSYKKNK
ncbi:MAG: hypothetical protein N3B16_06475, partial [Candidatus Aminicenantes bacterium]|nr:hypothetical protein [Candidatus Aminicenantes bacterium]